MNARKAAVLALLASTILFSGLAVDPVKAEPIGLVYRVSGTYDPAPGQTRVVDEEMSVTYDGSDVTINYHMTVLPYGIDTSILYLSEHSREEMIHDVENLPLTNQTPSNPFEPIFGCPVVVMTKTTSEYKLTIKWHKYGGYMLYMEIEKQNEMQKIVRFNYQSSTVDIYADLDAETAEKIQLIKFLFSPAGIALMSIPVLLITVLLCYISNTKKKVQGSSRKGRLLTR